MQPRTIPTLASLLALAACGNPAPFPSDDVARFESALAETHRSQASAGTTMAVDDGDHRWVGHAGSTALEAGAPVDEATRFRTASVGKTFTGALVLALHEEGALSVGDAVSDHLDVVPNGDAITLRMLLQHTSGVPNYTKVAAYREAVQDDPSRRFTYEELVELSVATGPEFPPGTAWDYSNTGYILLGMIVEQIVGRSIEEELRARFFAPLGMDDTRAVETEPPIGLWSGYRSVAGEPVEVTWSGGYPADGGAWVSSLDDMLTWARAFFGGQLHAPETLELAQTAAGGELLTSVAQSFGLETGGYGLGLVVGTDAAFGPLLAGAGNGDGARTFVAYAPRQDLAFAVAVNTGDGSVPIVETLSAAGPLLSAVRDRAP